MKKRLKFKLEKKQHLIKDLEFNEYCEQSKKKFPTGPWNKEPNKIYFKAYGFDCMVKRHGDLGFLCGYVGVPKDHELFDVDYDDTRVINLSVHGGITYSNRCMEDICHPSKNHVFWLGFDCGHAMDYIPALTSKIHNDTTYLKGKSLDVYRDIEYVTEQCKDLAKQLRYSF